MAESGCDDRSSRCGTAAGPMSRRASLATSRDLPGPPAARSGSIASTAHAAEAASGRHAHVADVVAEHPEQVRHGVLRADVAERECGGGATPAAADARRSRAARRQARRLEVGNDPVPGRTAGAVVHSRRATLRRRLRLGGGKRGYLHVLALDSARWRAAGGTRDVPPRGVDGHGGPRAGRAAPRARSRGRSRLLVSAIAIATSGSRSPWNIGVRGSPARASWELLRAERFADVVVRAGLEATLDVGLLRPGGQEDDRDRDPSPSRHAGGA